jgi:hypothetical protein
MWLADFSLIGSYTYTADYLQQVTGIVEADPMDPVAWMEWSAETAVAVEEQAGLLYTQRIAVSYARPTMGKREAILDLVGRRVAVIIEDNNGQYWLFGQEFGLEITEQRFSTGDASAVSFNLAGQDRNPRRGIADNAYTIILGTSAEDCGCDTGPAVAYRYGPVLSDWGTDLTPVLDTPISIVAS